MSAADKWRGGSSSHSFRSTASSRSSSSVIMPPPRAQLGHVTSSPPSPNPENDHEHLNIPARSKDAEAALSAKAHESMIIQEKDERIAALQQELEELEAKFVHQVNILSQNESEMASYWQKKHSNLNQQFLRTDAELRLLRAQFEVRENEREELKEGWEFLKREVQDRDEEIRRLKTLNSGLKEWVNKSTRSDGQESDEVFCEGMAKLANGLQNWVIMHFRRAKLDFAKADDGVMDELANLVPLHEELAGHAKLQLLQSIVSSIVVEMICEPLFVGLSKEQEDLLRSTKKQLSSLVSEEAVNHWRATTLLMIKKEASQKLRDQTAALAEGVISRVNRLLSSITDATVTDSRDRTLRILINDCVEIVRLLAVQKARFKLIMPKILPHQQTIFDASEMEDLGGEDEDNLIGREVCCVMFPGVVKFGDEHGGNTQFRNVIAKARVLCAPEE